MHPQWLVLFDKCAVRLPCPGCRPVALSPHHHSAPQSWEHGLASDTDPEWSLRLDQLRAYHRAHGDCSVGCREGDNRELARWVVGAVELRVGSQSPGLLAVQGRSQQWRPMQARAPLGAGLQRAAIVQP
jgi:hypothetical protein